MDEYELHRERKPTWAAVGSALAVLISIAAAAFSGLSWWAVYEQTNILGKQLQIARLPLLQLSCYHTDLKSMRGGGLENADPVVFPLTKAMLKEAYPEIPADSNSLWSYEWDVYDLVACDLRNFGGTAVTNVRLHFTGRYFRGNTYAPHTLVMPSSVDTHPMTLAANGNSVQRYYMTNKTCFGISILPPDAVAVTIPPDDKPQLVPIQVNQEALRSHLILGRISPTMQMQEIWGRNICAGV